MSHAVQKSNGTNYVISQKDYEDMMEFTRTDTFQARRNRIAEFFEADLTQEVALKMIKFGGATTVGCIATGAIIGGCTGGPKGAGIGAAVGLGTGIIISVIYSSVELRKHYVGWVRSREDVKIVDRFTAIHKEHLVLKDFLCPITQELMTDPVITPCGHTFEKEFIEKWIDQKTEQYKKNKNFTPECPECRAFITKDQLSTDYVLIGKMKKAYADLAKNEANNPIYDSAIKEAFIAMHKDLEVQTHEVLKQVSTHLTLQLTNGKLSPEAFSRKMREVTELYSEAKEEI